MQTNKYIGRVLKPFELDHIGSNEVPMVRFGLAVKRFPSAKAKTDFIYYVAYRDVAERVFKYANQKGLPVEIDFTQQSRTFENAEGKSVYRVENVVEKLMPWASLDKQSGQQTDATAHDTPVENEATLDDFEQQLPNDYEVY
ncbi:single-stranded DNA-binding protein [Weissella cibaria]|uniref:single-stranded DNA-binding protein n=1 Tax=Weissella cibaria TaxID=137591 RepID=UPI001FF47978|nr:single-stranded DNA-binding protein [Weissella cibaria]UOX37935.1 single-stranded DNA-binding protein [Weissella cibaria]